MVECWVLYGLPVVQARDVDPLRADSLIKRTIAAFEILKNNKGDHEKQVERLVGSDKFNDITFEENLHFRSIPREKLLAAITKSFEQRLLNDGSVASTSNQSSNDLEDVLMILKPESWDIENVSVPWLDGESRLPRFSLSDCKCCKKFPQFYYPSDR